MKGFMLDEKGDVVIKNNDIKLTDGKELIAQTVKQIIGTNLGEWFLNKDEGIDRYALLTKNPNYDEIRDNIRSALLQVDDTFEITSFEHSEEKRKLTIKFTATNSNGETIGMTV